MINPSLLVGLGTTGTDILMELRRLIFEEFGEPGLPLIKMVGIETDNRKQTKDRDINIDYNIDYHKIEMVHIGISDTQFIHEMLTYGTPVFHKDLKDWLDPEVLKLASYSHGARHIRMAGRLCLWLAWDNVRATLNQAYNSLLADRNKLRTEHILKSYFERKNIPVQAIDNRNPLVTVVGTFCGGTCSGTFIDVAYLLRDIIKSHGKQPAVTGIFTVPSKNMTDDVKRRIDAINCYTSLFELDYYHNPNTKMEREILTQEESPNLFKIQPIRNGNTIEDKDPPFNHVIIVSPTGQSEKGTSLTLVGQDGKIDPEPLNFMIALNLFMDIGAEVYQRKAAVLADLQAIPSFREIPKHGVGHAQFMSAFGLSALWYPKYKIVQAVAIKLAIELLDSWLADSKEEDNEAAKKAVQTFPHLDLFSSVEQQASFNKLISSKKESILNTDIYNFVNNIKELTYPNGTNILDQIKPGSSLFEEYNNQLQANIDTAKNNLLEFFYRLLNQLSSNFTSIDGVEKCLKYLDAELSNLIKKCPEKILDNEDLAEDAELNTISNQINDLNTDKWLYALFLRSDAIRKKKEKYLKRFESLINNQYGQIHKFFERKIYEDLRWYLGFDSSLKKPSLLLENETTIQKRLSILRSALNEAKESLDKEYENVMKIKSYPSIKIAIDFEGTIDKILKEQRHRLIVQNSARIFKEIINNYGNHYFEDIMYEPGTLDSILDSDEKTNIIVDPILTVFRSEITKIIPQRNDPLGHYKIDVNGTRDLFVNLSLPMMSFKTIDLIAGHLPRIAFGPNTHSIQKVLTAATITDLEVKQSDYDNFVMIYREYGPLSFDQMNVYSSWKQYYENDKTFIKHTHKKPFPKPLPSDSGFFNWLKVGLLFNHTLNVFDRDENNNFTRKITALHGIKKTMVIKSDNEIYNEFIQSSRNRRELESIIKGECTKIGKEPFVELISEYLESAYQDKESDEYIKESNFLVERVTELFGLGN